ncbi:putative membrane protein YeaQ/YmgE (transglycosylase-associated protein family) [Blastococcus colisei]|uniref:Putative membrane protein YeaQ/YmgE (Transglycosylase-associated protein family) n=1 Tax=Blastococcus colisei TaxID=1564162 RepID=A0A543P9D1_9ACTN|nr:GlsB/YeaQ/YmgE family stress response membrane protein [Blastococcus colisei]TQN40672.1 putative membrane protein YeaQ/YmgE (transglycosylase-associated protein family) [Blastococcus colisei]
MLFDILGLIVIGLVIGALARLILPGKQRISIVATLALGVLGALIGGWIASLLGTGDIFELNVLGFVLAVIAAIVLVGAYAGMAGRSNRAVR